VSHQILQTSVVLAAIIVAHILVIKLTFSGYPADYLRIAFTHTWVVLICITALQLFVGFVVFYVLSRRVSSDPVVQLLLLPGSCGFLVVLFPGAIGLLVRSSVSADLLKKKLIRRLIRLNSWCLRMFGREVQRCLERDNIDWQRSCGKWSFPGVDPPGVGGRIRLLYEYHKEQIARERKKSDLMKMDAGVHSGRKFYLLAKHLGRNRLHSEIASPPGPLGPGYDWGGRPERRRKHGDYADRKNPDPNPNCSRSYDNDRLMRAIDAGGTTDYY